MVQPFGGDRAKIQGFQVFQVSAQRYQVVQGAGREKRTIFLDHFGSDSGSLLEMKEWTACQHFYGASGHFVHVKCSWWAGQRPRPTISKAVSTHKGVILWFVERRRQSSDAIRLHIIGAKSRPGEWFVEGVGCSRAFVLMGECAAPRSPVLFRPDVFRGMGGP